MPSTNPIRYTLVEYMPACHRASHIAARNSGSYPHNGAERVYVEGDYTSRDLDPRWASVIEDSIERADIPEDEPVLSELPDDAMAPYVGDEG